MHRPLVELSHGVRGPCVAVSELFLKGETLTFGDDSDFAGFSPSEGNLILDEVKGVNHKGRVFLLRWQGGLVPYGTVINGSRIGWIMNNKVIDAYEKPIGNYKRIRINGGLFENEQIVIVFLK